MATLGEKFDEVKRTGNARLAGQIADFLRFKHGFNYNDVAAMAQRHGIDADTWEALQYEADAEGV